MPSTTYTPESPLKKRKVEHDLDSITAIVQPKPQVVASLFKKVPSCHNLISQVPTPSRTPEAEGMNVDSDHKNYHGCTQCSDLPGASTTLEEHDMKKVFKALPNGLRGPDSPTIYARYVLHS
ncbi:hypothetical protein BABINDRAFT_159021 [Babjeviella inositovora NRRL Y-12698]|uniref:Uncharacterized protein n=1 Tax=Babjeviella inositovora NRRL Y-12698 TaxID=984486 RepID=A0A1E3QXP7_9ASCO|nr:uncharacterized protein BABINDRAFT_159021 [Babjeviella inositovora NRRL Y-12698]ODQ82426.1 hypothetical protein BABINDRAFT_159021 [Babjeviella inositovora NRRL Y-12698]